MNSTRLFGRECHPRLCSRARAQGRSDSRTNSTGPSDDASVETGRGSERWWEQKAYRRSVIWGNGARRGELRSQDTCKGEPGDHHVLGLQRDEDCTGTRFASLSELLIDWIETGNRMLRWIPRISPLQLPPPGRAAGVEQTTSARTTRLRVQMDFSSWFV